MKSEKNTMIMFQPLIFRGVILSKKSLHLFPRFEYISNRRQSWLQGFPQPVQGGSLP